jgi:hypothetical protein
MPPAIVVLLAWACVISTIGSGMVFGNHAKFMTPAGLCQAQGLVDYPPNLIPPVIPLGSIGK